jgi:hypothetical protein
VVELRLKLPTTASTGSAELGEAVCFLLGIGWARAVVMTGAAPW